MTDIIAYDLMQRPLRAGDRVCCLKNMKPEYIGDIQVIAHALPLKYFTTCIARNLNPYNSVILEDGTAVDCKDVQKIDDDETESDVESRQSLEVS